ncbi:MAG TPA: thioredoxin family protein [Ignavibacteria bacterium]|nr:thioredoxin family protein [Ignavibacteria bacterium]
MVEVKVLGSGCARCKELEKMCFNVAVDNNIDADIQKISDLKEIMSYGIMQTPGLVINGKVKLAGKLPTAPTLLHWMQEG